MPIDFHAESNRFSYTRQADPSWVTAIKGIVDVRGKRVLDIGCGGGIYSKALAEMGAASVTGVDFSEEALKGARENCRDYASIDFVVGNALNTGLPDQQCDVILERSLIHHLGRENVRDCFVEALRLLKPGGTLIVQDRTPGDCLLPANPNNLRGYFFVRYPKLINKEVGRRPDNEFVLSTLQNVGFKHIQEHKLWETRRTYTNFDELREDLLSRTGRSILHELSDEELADLVTYIQEQFHGNDEQAIVERDRWTLWSAQKEINNGNI